jgi:hypothetical protein
VVLGTFNLRVVPIGVDDQDGLPVTSCTINVIELGSSGDASAKRSRRPKLNSKESRCRDNLTRLYEQKKDLSVPGTDIGIPDADVGERWRVIKLSDLKDACRKGKLTIAPEGDTPAKESDREYQAFKRAIEALDTKHKLIGRYDDYVWDLEINRKRGRHNLSTGSTNPTKSIGVDPVDTDSEISTDSTPFLKGVGLSITSRQGERGREKGSNHEESELPRPSGEATTQPSSLPRIPETTNQPWGDDARLTDSTLAQVDVGPVAPDRGDEVPVDDISLATGTRGAQ